MDKEKIIGAMPTPYKIKAVFLNGTKTEEVFREPVFMAIVRKESPCDEGNYDDIVPYYFDNDAHFSPSCTDSSTFLGLEYDGEEKNWKWKIKEVKETIERKRKMRAEEQAKNQGGN